MVSCSSGENYHIPQRILNDVHEGVNYIWVVYCIPRPKNHHTKTPKRNCFGVSRKRALVRNAWGIEL